MVGNINKRNVSRVESTEYTLSINTAERAFANEAGWLGSVGISLCDSVAQKAANRKKGLRRCSGSTSSKPDEASGSFLGHPKGTSEAFQLVVAAVRNTASIPSRLRLDLKSLAGAKCKNLCQQNLVYSLIIALVLFFLSTIVSAGSTAPPGYQWQSCRAVECSFLVPDGWRFEHLENGNVLKYQMTKNRQGRVVTPKVRISILRDSEARTGISVERHLQLFTSDLKRTAKVLETWNSKSGVLTSRAATSIHYAKVDQPVKQFSLLIANGLTGTLYVFSFEALPEVWDREWAIVEQVFAHLRLDEKI